MRLGELLVLSHWITADQLEQALTWQMESGGRIGDLLVKGGAIERETLEDFLRRVPAEPDSIEATGVDAGYLLDLMIKLVYSSRLETGAEIGEAIRLPPFLVNELIRTAVDRRLLRTLGQRDNGLAYTLTEEGLRRGQDAMQQCAYAGPAPVSLDAFIHMVKVQRVNNNRVTFERIRQAFHGLTVLDSFIEKIGPALNSDRSILLYGPPGNGKTSYAQRFADIFNDMIYIPYAVLVGGQIIKVFDPSSHTPVEPLRAPQVERRTLVREEENDLRWVPCQRPFLVAGGELTLEMLDLQFDSKAVTYEAPLHVKALGGCFMIDDFGRQLTPPAALLNRWIVPMESRIDYLKLHTGKSFVIPFEELLIFSTNLEPEDLMDPAFLRRLPYKLEVGAPDLASFRDIFNQVAEDGELEITDEIFDNIVHKITQVKHLELAAYQPRFIVDQVVAACRFLQQPPRLEDRFIDYAIDNLRVHRQVVQS